MSLFARIEGTYRHRTRINLLLFSIVGPWKTEPFKFEKALPESGLHWSWRPIANMPVSASLDLVDSGATFSLQLLDQFVPLKHVSLQVGTSQSFHFEPVKGNVIEGTASVVAA